MRGSAYVEPEWICLHPSDYQICRLLRDGTGGTVGQMFGGGPWLGAYGNGGQVSSGVVAGATDVMWGKRVYVTPAIGGAGTALIGTTANACVWNRGGLRVEATSSHDKFFQLNLIAVRAERRMTLTTYRAAGYSRLLTLCSPSSTRRRSPTWPRSSGRTSLPMMAGSA